MEHKVFEIMQQLESHHWWFVARRKIISKVINCLVLPENTRILEAGCGNGDNLTLLSNFGDVTAFEKMQTPFKGQNPKKLDTYTRVNYQEIYLIILNQILIWWCYLMCLSISMMIVAALVLSEV
jgi:protein-L-isoaspartate O-methyltransferase